MDYYTRRRNAMTRTIIASTEHIDDLKAAGEDIRGQIEGKLLKNSVGIIACHYEFVLSGAVKAICGDLPFEVTGAITSFHTDGRRAATLLLSVMVITSDDLAFRTILTPSLKGGGAGKIIEKTYAEEVKEKPSLILPFAPFMVENSGDEYVNVLSEVSGGVPCFGTLAVDDTSDFRECYMLYNGEHYRDRMSLILVYGNITPRFFLAAISEKKIVDKPALITRSEGHVIKEINGRPVTEYFQSMGLTKASETSYAMTSLPFMIDYRDGTPPVSRVFIALNENKEAICAGAMPEGVNLYLGVFDKSDVLVTSREAIRNALGNGEAHGILIYSCLSRSMSLGSDQFAEIDLIKKEIGGKLPFLLAYSGGEICPTMVSEGSAVNRFHNNTFIACVF
jgi:hypothetical protein